MQGLSWEEHSIGGRERYTSRSGQLPHSLLQNLQRGLLRKQKNQIITSPFFCLLAPLTSNLFYTYPPPSHTHRILRLFTKQHANIIWLLILLVLLLFLTNSILTKQPISIFFSPLSTIKTKQSTQNLPKNFQWTFQNIHSLKNPRKKSLLWGKG